MLERRPQTFPDLRRIAQMQKRFNGEFRTDEAEKPKVIEDGIVSDIEQTGVLDEPFSVDHGMREVQRMNQRRLAAGEKVLEVVDVRPNEKGLL